VLCSAREALHSSRSSRYLGGEKEKETSLKLTNTQQRRSRGSQLRARTGEYLADVVNKRKSKHLNPSTHIFLWNFYGSDVGRSVAVKRLPVQLLFFGEGVEVTFQLHSCLVNGMNDQDKG